MSLLQFSRQASAAQPTWLACPAWGWARCLSTGRPTRGPGAASFIPRWGEYLNQSSGSSLSLSGQDRQESSADRMQGGDELLCEWQDLPDWCLPGHGVHGGGEGEAVQLRGDGECGDRVWQQHRRQHHLWQLYHLHSPARALWNSPYLEEVRRQVRGQRLSHSWCWTRTPWWRSEQWAALFTLVITLLANIDHLLPSLFCF